MTRWDDLETVPMPPTEYGIRCRQGRGKWMHAGKDGKLALWKTHNEANEERLRLIALKAQVQCGILGCGDSYPKAEMRTYRLGTMGVACCPECWKALELPEDCRDTADLSRMNAIGEARADNATPPKPQDQ